MSGQSWPFTDNAKQVAGSHFSCRVGLLLSKKYFVVQCMVQITHLIAECCVTLWMLLRWCNYPEVGVSHVCESRMQISSHNLQVSSKFQVTVKKIKKSCKTVKSSHTILLSHNIHWSDKNTFSLIITLHSCLLSPYVEILGLLGPLIIFILY